MDDARDAVAAIVDRIFDGCAPGTVRFTQSNDYTATPLPDGPGCRVSLTFHFDYRPPLTADAEPSTWRDRPAQL